MDSADRLEAELADALAVVRDANPPGRPLTTSEVAAALDCEVETASRRLERLSERGAVRSRTVCENRRLWWRPSEPARTDGSEPEATESTGADARHEHRTVLRELTAVVREVVASFTRQTTRATVEELICERLAASDAYVGAWVGEVDPDSRTVELRTTAGIDDGVLTEVVSTEADESGELGPAGRAVRTKGVQVSRSVEQRSGPSEDDESERRDAWLDLARRHGWRSVAAIPIVHEGSLYAVLSVGADRADAFGAGERAALANLGEVVGHAIANAEREHAFCSDTVTEITFRIRDVYETFDAPPTDGRIEFERAVRVDDDEFLDYGTVTADATETLDALAEQIPHWHDVTLVDEDDPPDGTGENGRDRPVKFELRHAEPPAFTSVAANGGYVRSARMVDGDYEVTVHLPPSAEVREVVEGITETYPTAEMLTRRQISTESDSRREFRQSVLEALSERQYGALEAAFHSGYFDWPRTSSGEDIAESLGVAPATFSQHIRIAQRKVFEELLVNPDASFE